MDRKYSLKNFIYLILSRPGSCFHLMDKALFNVCLLSNSAGNSDACHTLFIIIQWFKAINRPKMGPADSLGKSTTNVPRQVPHNDPICLEKSHETFFHFFSNSHYRHGDAARGIGSDPPASPSKSRHDRASRSR
jgi:hypothetical protein